MKRKERLIYLIYNNNIKDIDELDDLYYDDMDDETKEYYYDMMTILTNKYHIANSGFDYNMNIIMEEEINFKHKLIQNRRMGLI